MANALVVGGGVVGLSVGIRLSERGFRVTVVDDPPPAGAASWGNIGHIATEQCAPLASWATIRSLPWRLFSMGGPVGLPPRAISSWLPFGLRMMQAARRNRYDAGVAALADLLSDALPAWRRLNALWPNASLLQEGGHYVVWESSERARAGREAWASAPIGTASFRELTDAEFCELAALTPKILPHAIRFENTGKILDLRQLRTNLQQILQQRGGETTLKKASRIDVVSGKAIAILADGETLKADAIVVCAGARSVELLAPLGHAVPLIAERGYHVEYSSSPLSPSSLPVVFEDRSVVVNRFQHGLRIAGFVEFAAASTPPDERKWQRLEKHVDELGIVAEGAKQRWMGARPTLPDYLPAIGKSNKASNLFYAFGHQHLGLTLAPITAEVISDLVFEGLGQRSLNQFSLDRFG